MAHHEPPHQDLRRFQIQLFASLVVKVYYHKEMESHIEITYQQDWVDEIGMRLKVTCAYTRSLINNYMPFYENLDFIVEIVIL